MQGQRLLSRIVERVEFSEKERDVVTLWLVGAATALQTFSVSENVVINSNLGPKVYSHSIHTVGVWRAFEAGREEFYGALK